jgi:hypothetical protein
MRVKSERRSSKKTVQCTNRRLFPFPLGDFKASDSPGLGPPAPHTPDLPFTRLYCSKQEHKQQNKRRDLLKIHPSQTRVVAAAAAAATVSELVLTGAVQWVFTAQVNRKIIKRKNRQRNDWKMPRTGYIARRREQEGRRFFSRFLQS